MKVLLAKRPASPRRGDDIWSAVEGEVVVSPFVCEDDECSCDRIHQGLVSHGYSTVAVVRDVSLESEALVLACRAHLTCSQWAAITDNPAELEMLAVDLIDDMVDVASRFPVETTVRMAFDHVALRWRYTAV